ncbi:MAG: FHIPEP family type III secretion protein, partial [Oscillospiraceae bacterium]
KDVSKQFLSQPNALIITGGVLIGFILIPGFPKMATLMLGSLLVFLGTRLIGTQKQIENELIKANESTNSKSVKEADFYKNIDNVYDLISVDPMELEFGYSIVSMVSNNKGNAFVDRVVMLRKQFALDMGFVFPSVRLRDNTMLAPNQYIIKIKGEEVARGEVLVDYYLALDSGNVKGQIDGIDTVEPAYGIPSKWILKSDKEQAEAYGYTIIDPISVIITHLSEVIRHHAFELISRKDLLSLVENVKKTGRISTDDIIPDLISVIDLHKIISNLLKEFIPIKDMETILSTIADNISTTKDTDTLTEYVRQALKRTVTRTFARDGSIMVISLSSKIEKLILSGLKKADNRTYLNIDPEKITEIVDGVNEQIEKHKNMFTTPIILTSSVVRIHISRLLEQFIPNVAVLSFSEIENNVQILALGNVTVKD